MLDARGDYARAGDASARPTRISHELAQGSREYVPAEHERFVDRLIQAFDAGVLRADRPDAGHDSRRPVFVFGLPRSGTTLIEQVLASHSRVHGAGELRLARQSFEAIPAIAGPARPAHGLRPPPRRPDRVRRLAEQHLERARGHSPAAGPTASSTRCPTITCTSACWPSCSRDATFIHCRRDLRDVAVSCWMTDFRSIRWANDPEHIASRFQQYRRLMDHWRGRPAGADPSSVDYEETVADLEGVARRLIARLRAGVGARPAWSSTAHERPVRTASVTQVRQPVYKQSVARWKNYDASWPSCSRRCPLV